MRSILILLTATIVSVVQAKGYDYRFAQIDPQFDSIAAILSKYDFENQRELIQKEQTTALWRIAERNNDDQLRSRAIYWKVRATQMKASPQQCIPLLEKAKSLCKASFDYDRASIDYQLAGNYERTTHYLKAYDLLQEAIPVFQHHGDHFMTGNAELLLAQLFIDINDPDNAKEPLRRAKEEYSKAGFRSGRIFFFEASLDDGGHKLQLFRRSVESGGYQDWGMTLQAMNSISNIFVDRNEIDSAAKYSAMSLDLLKRKDPDNTFFATLVAICRAKVLLAQGHTDEAILLLSHEEAKKDMLCGERFLADIYELLWQANEKKGRRDDAYKYLKLFMKESERVDKEIRRQDIPKKRAREAIARRNDTITLLEKDAELSRRRVYLMILAMAVVVIAAVALIVVLWQRYKIRKMENRELRNSLQQEALIYSVNRKNFERDIKQKECEISSSTLLLANKNEVLQQISDITKRYSSEGKVPIEYVQQVNEVIGDSLKNDDEWQRFKLHFDSVHPNFFVKLKECSQELSENDLRLCAYIRIGMRAKQIAEMLSVSPDSINSNRYRLRKKLGLQRGESLDDFVRKV